MGKGGPMAFLNKKTWHPGRVQNMEEVWKREQEAAKEDQKMKDLQKQIAEERAREEMLQVAEAAGVKVRSDRLDWMYQGGVAARQEADQRQAAAGGAPDKSARDEQEENLKGRAGAVAALPSFYSEDTPASANEMWQRLHADPLFAIKQQEVSARRTILSNPVQMQAIKAQVKQLKGGRDTDSEEEDGRDKRHRHRHHKDRKKEKKRKKERRDRSRSRSRSPRREKSRRRERNGGDGEDSRQRDRDSSKRPREDTDRDLRERDDLDRRRRKRSRSRSRSRSPRRYRDDSRDRNGGGGDHRNQRRHSRRSRSRSPERGQERRHRGDYNDHNTFKDRKAEDGGEIDDKRRPEVHMDGASAQGAGAQYGITYGRHVPEAVRNQDRSHLAEATRKRLEEAARRKEQEEREAAAERNRRRREQQHRPGRLTDEEKQRRLQEMTAAANEHDSQRHKRIEEYEKIEAREAAEQQGRGHNDTATFLQAATKDVYGAGGGGGNGGGGSLADAVGRRKAFQQRGDGGGASAFRK